MFIDFCLKKLKVFSQHIGKNKCISEFCRTNPRELKCWSTFCVNYFLRYYLMMQHQTTVKRVNGTHEWAHRPYQLLINAAFNNTGGKMKGSHPRAADRCPFVLRHILSQVTSFMQLGMLCGWNVYMQRISVTELHEGSLDIYLQDIRSTILALAGNHMLTLCIAFVSSWPEITLCYGRQPTQNLISRLMYMTSKELRCVCNITKVEII